MSTTTVEKTLNKIRYQDYYFENSKPDSVEESGVDTDDDYDTSGKRLVERLPYKIQPTLANFRYTAKDPLIRGLITNLRTKVLANYVIDGDNQAAIDLITERFKEYDGDQLLADMIEKGLIDGELFYFNAIVDGWLKPVELAVDGDKYRMKKLYNEFGEPEFFQHGYPKRQIIKSTDINGTDSFEVKQETKTYPANEILNPIFLKANGKPNNPVRYCMEQVYYKRILEHQSVLIVFKNSSVIEVSVGINKNGDLISEKKLSKIQKESIRGAYSNFEKNGVIFLPPGIVSKVLGGKPLPKLDSYINQFEDNIYIAFQTPKAQFSNVSSNRATAEVQLDSDDSGSKLFIRYIQNWLKRYVEDVWFRIDLDNHGHSNSKVWLDFNPVEEDEDNAVLETETTTSESANKTEPNPKDNTKQKDDENDTVGGNNEDDSTTNGGGE